MKRHKVRRIERESSIGLQNGDGLDASDSNSVLEGRTDFFSGEQLVNISDVMFFGLVLKMGDAARKCRHIMVIGKLVLRIVVILEQKQNERNDVCWRRSIVSEF